MPPSSFCFSTSTTFNCNRLQLCNIPFSLLRSSPTTSFPTNLALFILLRTLFCYLYIHNAHISVSGESYPGHWSCDSSANSCFAQFTTPKIYWVCGILLFCTSPQTEPERKTLLALFCIRLWLFPWQTLHFRQHIININNGSFRRNRGKLNTILIKSSSSSIFLVNCAIYPIARRLHPSCCPNYIFGSDEHLPPSCLHYLNI